MGQDRGLGQARGAGRIDETGGVLRPHCVPTAGKQPRAAASELVTAPQSLFPGEDPTFAFRRVAPALRGPLEQRRHGFGQLAGHLRGRWRTYGRVHAATIRELRRLAIGLWRVVTYPYGTKMVVGTCELIFQLPENHSLKGKRQVSRSLVQQLRGRFNVSVAEVADLDRWQSLAIGVTCVSNDSRHANAMLSKIVDFVEDHNGGAVLHQHHIEILRT